MGVLSPLIKLILLIVGIIAFCLIVLELIIHKRHYAEFNFDDGSYYQGQISHLGINGKGKLFMPCGDTYEGKFKKNLFHGNGLYIWSDGSRFEGKFKKGLLLSGIYADKYGNLFKCRYAYLNRGGRITKEFSLIQRVSDKIDGEVREVEPVQLNVKGNKN